jgi:hypothetical protein
LARPLLDDDTRLQHVPPIRDFERLGRVLLDQEHRGALGVDLAHDAEDRLLQDRRQAQRRLVQQHHLRLRHERATHRQHLLLATGQRARDLCPPLLEAREELEHTVHVGSDAGLVAARVGAHEEVVEDAHAGEKPPAFRRLADSELDDSRGARARDVLAFEFDRPRGRVHEAGNGSERRGLAGAVGADQGDDLAFVDVDRHTAQGLDAPVQRIDAFELEQRHLRPA